MAGSLLQMKICVHHHGNLTALRSGSKLWEIAGMDLPPEGLCSSQDTHFFDGIGAGAESVLPVRLQPYAGQNHQTAAKPPQAIEPKPLHGKNAIKQAHMPTWISSSGTASATQVAMFPGAQKVAEASKYICMIYPSGHIIQADGVQLPQEPVSACH